jgi:signal transduction histidine kinase
VDPLLDRAPCGFLVVDDDGHVMLANATMAEMLEAPDASALVGRHVDSLLSTASRIFYQTHVFPTLRLQGTVHEVYVSLVDAAGGELPVLLNARRRAEGERTVSDWALVPMRQRNELENEILQARRVAEESVHAKDQFLALVTHELRSPLGAIRNWAAILAKQVPDAATLKRGLEAIERNARLQATLIEDILDEVRVATGKLHLDLREVDARSVLNNVLEGAAAAASAKSIVIERDLSEEPLPVRVDLNRLQQVFWNIVNNALKFTPAAGHIRVAMRRVESWVEVAVTDTGRGISPEFLPFVFERFRQEGGGTHSAGGLGLGMAITRKLVELHGGSISAASEGVGHGATFTVRLPASEARPPTEPAVANRSLEGDRRSP